jgi:hypothetical protein
MGGIVNTNTTTPSPSSKGGELEQLPLFKRGAGGIVNTNTTTPSPSSKGGELEQLPLFKRLISLQNFKVLIINHLTIIIFNWCSN